MRHAFHCFMLIIALLAVAGRPAAADAVSPADREVERRLRHVRLGLDEMRLWSNGAVSTKSLSSHSPLLVVHLFSLDCPPCLREIKHLQRLFQQNTPETEFAMVLETLDANRIRQFKIDYKEQFPDVDLYISTNRRIRDAVDGDLGAVSGSPYTLPRVSTTIGDGRSTLAARDKKYDHIQIGFVDTFSASSAQAFALTENNLYTVEAFREYYDHLAPRGVLNVSRPYRHVGDEALRATVLTLEALRRRGIRHPERNVVVVLGRYSLYLRSFSYAAVLSRLEPFTAAELVRIRRLARERGSGVAFAPGGPYQREWRQLAAASSPQAFCESYRLDVCAPTDDKPFFFFMKRFDRLGGGATSAEIGVPDPIVVLLITLGILLALAALAVVVPLALVRRQGRPPAGSLVYFAAIGLGFLMLEVVLIQRFVLFLGFPTYALSVVLFALLVSTGAGAALTARLRPDPRRQLVAVLATACALIAASSYGLGPLLRALIDLPFAGRLAVTCALLAPLGVLLGMAMPIGLRRLADLYPAGVPWAWGINGIASVVASVAAVTLAIAVLFLTGADSAMSGSGPALAVLQVLGVLSGGVFGFFSMWWAAQNCIHTIERTLFAAKAGRHQLFVGFVEQLQCSGKKKREILIDMVKSAAM